MTDMTTNVTISVQNASGHAQAATQIVPQVQAPALPQQRGMEPFVAFGRDLVTDTLALGRMSLEVRSFADAMSLQTAFVERRVQAAFGALAAMRAIAEAAYPPPALSAQRHENGLRGILPAA